MKVVMIGAGNLACNLGVALKRAGHEIVWVYSRTGTSAKYLADLVQCLFTTDITQLPTDADLYVYALKDDVLPDIVKQVIAPQAIHVHTAGSVPMAVLAANKVRYGVLYPLQTFSKQRLADFHSIPLFVEASDAVTLDVLLSVARQLSRRVYEADTCQRKQLHLAAVFACNFVNCMYSNAERIVQRAGIPFDVLLPLIDETAAKVHYLTPAEAQTGPAVRCDRTVMDRHVADLEDGMQRNVYRLLSEDIYVYNNLSNKNHS